MQNPEDIDLRYNGASGIVARDKVRLLDSKRNVDSWMNAQMA